MGKSWSNTRYLGSAALCRLVLIGILTAGLTHADVVTIGYVEFDLDSLNNLYITTVANQTGAAGCTISYPVCDPLRFLNGTLSIDYADGAGTLGSVTVPLSDTVDVGADVPPELQFDGSLTLLDASFEGSLDTASFLLFDGTIFDSDGTVSGSGDLTADNFFFLYANTAPPVTSVPEPGSLWQMLTVAAIGLYVLGRRRNASHS